MATPRYTSLILALSVVLGSATAQSHTEPGSDIVQSIADTEPAAIVRLDADTGALDALMNVRIDGYMGSSIDVASMVLEDIYCEKSPGTACDGFVDARTLETQAGGRRILFHGSGSLDGFAYLVGVTRERSGDRFYVDEIGRVAPSGFVFVRSDEIVDYDEVRDDWQVYFVLRSKVASMEAPQLASADGFPGLAGPNTPEFSMHASETDDAVLRVPRITGRDLSPPSAGIDYSGCPTGEVTDQVRGNVFASNPLNGNPHLGALPHLCDLFPRTLDGQYVQVVQEPGVSIMGVNGEFVFNPDEPAFDAVSAYFHIDRFVTFMQSRGYPVFETAENGTALLTDPIEVTTRSSSTLTAVAGYRDGTLVLGIPSPPYRNAAHEAAIIAHETTHILMFPLTASYFGRGLKEHWAMGEAFADYFGLVYRSHQRQNEGPWVEPMFGIYASEETTQDLPRDISSDLPHFGGYGYTNFVGRDDPGVINEYDNSVIFSTALVDYDRIDHSDNSAAFVIESLFNMPGTPSFHGGRDALMIAASSCATSGDPDTYECCEESVCSLPVAVAFAGRGIGASDEGIVTTVEPAHGIAPKPVSVRLDGAYPNPFSDRSTIEFALDRSVWIRVDVYDASGRHVRSLLDDVLPPGTHTAVWSPTSLSSGPYFFEIKSETTVRRGALILVK